MTHYERLKRKRLGDLIVDEGLAEKELVIAALQEQQQTGRLLSSILLDSEMFDQYDLARVITEQYQVPFVDLENYSPHKDLITEFPAELLHRARILPLDRFGKSVAFACQEIPSPEVHKKLKELCGDVFVFAAFARDIILKLQENHPWNAPDVHIPAHQAPSIAPKGALLEDRSWQSLFDSANESVLSELGDDD